MSDKTLQCWIIENLLNGLSNLPNGMMRYLVISIRHYNPGLTEKYAEEQAKEACEHYFNVGIQNVI